MIVDHMLRHDYYASAQHVASRYEITVRSLEMNKMIHSTLTVVDLAGLSGCGSVCY